MIKKFHSLFIIYICLFFTAYGQETDYELSRLINLQERWKIYAEGQYKDYTPELNPKAIYFPLGISDTAYYLQLKFPPGTACWINGELYRLWGQDTVSLVPVNQLLKSYGGEVMLTMFAENLDKDNLQTWLALESDNEDSSPVVRTQTYVDEFLVTLLLIILSLIGLIRTKYPRLLNELLMVVRSIVPRSREEYIFQNKITSRPVFLIQTVVSLSASFMMLMMLYLSPHFFNKWIQVDPVTYGEWLGWCLVFALSIWIALWIKWILIRNIAYLFRLSGFDQIHYLNFLRYTFFLLMIGVMGVSFIYLVSVSNNPAGYLWFFYTLLSLFIFLSVLMFFKLISNTHYTIMHLFSYLCGTEIIPIVLLLKVLLIER